MKQLPISNKRWRHVASVPPAIDSSIGFVSCHLYINYL